MEKYPIIKHHPVLTCHSPCFLFHIYYTKHCGTIYEPDWDFDLNSFVLSALFSTELGTLLQAASALVQL